MELLFQAVAQLERLIDQAKTGEDRHVLLGLMEAQDCVLERLWPSLNQVDNDEVCFHGKLDPDHPTTPDKRTKDTES
jgi:hypothetical protein